VDGASDSHQRAGARGFDFKADPARRLSCRRLFVRCTRLDRTRFDPPIPRWLRGSVESATMRFAWNQMERDHSNHRRSHREPTKKMNRSAFQRQSASHFEESIDLFEALSAGPFSDFGRGWIERCSANGLESVERHRKELSRYGKPTQRLRSKVDPSHVVHGRKSILKSRLFRVRVPLH